MPQSSIKAHMRGLFEPEAFHYCRALLYNAIIPNSQMEIAKTHPFKHLEKNGNSSVTM
jgi:hypothetical protein